MFSISTRLTICLSIVTLASQSARAGDDLRYNRDVRPILADTCFRCHGPGAKKAGLRLDRPESAFKPTESGATPLVPGKPGESEVIQRVFSNDPDEVMPPPSAGKPLDSARKAILKAWVESGAAYEPHWSFVPPVKMAVPRVEGLGFRVRNPVDAFLANRLRREGLTMSAQADPETLIRRVAFALTGLPSTQEEVAQFLRDTSPLAYENMVDRYLLSPHYGEEMARHWLDVARYADTHGLHLDNERQMWLYRDWVVRAFNENVPFDRFTTDQLAGDLIPDATQDQRIATGFNRCNVTTGEGGSIESEWYFRNAVDRASTTAEAWMGLTAGCAVCHDHKYDPITANDFYSLYAFFYSAAGPALDSNALAHEPFLKYPSPAQEAKLKDLASRIDRARQDIEDEEKALACIDPAIADIQTSFAAWLAALEATLAKDAPAEVRTLLTQSKAKKLPPEGEARLRSYYVRSVCEATRGRFAPLIKKVADLTKEREALDATIPGSFVFKEASTPRDAFIMVRGQYDKLGTKVEPNTPLFLPPLKRANPTARATRLDLARWLLAPEHPLAARVAVNRLWQQLFGTGLVKTSFDFGTQGEPPSHSELLDWLAVEFREGGWDVRALVRLMVTSETFRQSSRVTPELVKRDPENRLYARGPRFRLDAEQVRDNALFVSGLIDLTMGGRGVKPYQPPNIWEPVAFTGSNTRSYQQDKGTALYRRSLYTFLKRTAPPPFMANFDAPSREFFCTRRERSNTPLQALQLMNDVQHVEAARALAQRMMTQGGETPDERLAFGFRLVLARRPEPEEVALLRDQWNQHQARFARDSASAEALVRVGESKPRPGLAMTDLAAFTLVANTLLNLDETVTRN
jgi:hypothetical protein